MLPWTFPCSSEKDQSGSVLWKPIPYCMIPLYSAHSQFVESGVTVSHRFSFSGKARPNELKQQFSVLWTEPFYIMFPPWHTLHSIYKHLPTRCFGFIFPLVTGIYGFATFFGIRRWGNPSSYLKSGGFWLGPWLTWWDLQYSQSF